MNIQPIAQSSLVDRVAERLRRVIEDGQLRAGDRLPAEAELSEKLQVSRSVLREAVSRLETLGLLTVRRGRGMFVGDRGSLSSCVQFVRSAMTVAPKDLMQFAELRRGVEIQASRLAAVRAVPEDVAELEKLYHHMDSPDLDFHEAIRADFQFHRKLVEITGNELMLNVIEVLHEFIIAGMETTTPNPRDHKLSRRVHRPILEAVRAGDPDAAEKAMKFHMDSLEHRLHEAARSAGASPAARQ